MSTRISTNYHRYHQDSQNRTVRRSSTTSHKRTLGPDHTVSNSSRRIHSLQQPRTSNKFQEQDISYGSPRHQHHYTDTSMTRDTHMQARPQLRRLSTPDLTDTLTNSRSDSDSELNSPTYRHNSRSSPQLSIPGAWPASPITYTEEPGEITVDGLSDEFDYVILRVPAKSRASSIASFSSSARKSMDSSRRGSIEEDLTERCVSRLSTPEATHLVQSIKALKTPVPDQTRQFAMYSPDRSTSWRVDDMGKYEYLVLRSSSQMSTARPRMSSEESDKIALESDENDEVESLNIANPGFPLDEIADQWHDAPQSFSTYHRSSSYTEITASLFAYKPEEIRGSSPYQVKNASMPALEVPQRPRSRSLTELRQYPTQSANEPSHLDQKPRVPEHRNTMPPSLTRSSSSGSQKLARLLSTVSRRSLQSLKISSATEIGNQMEQVWERSMEQAAVAQSQSGLTRKYTLSRPSFWDPSHQVQDAAMQHSPKPSIGFKILSIFRPRKMRVRSLMRQQHLLERGWAVERARSPCIAYMQDMGIHLGRLNPFAIIKYVNVECPKILNQN
ncbi:hypothetical protein BC943DRAFT_83617 [Umbelopsis sp. AD052]|nr:hypothetical protein BC943DRAFT_83617 [Umbelopsis sp. AD052]